MGLAERCRTLLQSMSLAEAIAVPLLVVSVGMAFVAALGVTGNVFPSAILLAATGYKCLVRLSHNQFDDIFDGEEAFGRSCCWLMFDILNVATSAFLVLIQLQYPFGSAVGVGKKTEITWRTPLGAENIAFAVWIMIFLLKPMIRLFGCRDNEQAGVGDSKGSAVDFEHGSSEQVGVMIADNHAQISSSPVPKGPTHRSDTAASPIVPPASVTGSEGQCVVCQAALAICVCVPCGHMALCPPCGQKIRESGQKCPLCRAHIREVIRVYVH